MMDQNGHEKEVSPIEASPVEAKPQQNPDSAAPLPKPPTHLLLILSAVFAGIALVLIGGYYLGNLLFKPQEIKPSGIVVVPTTATNNNPEADPTAKWKTYTDLKYGFSLKYPGTWRQTSQSTDYTGNTDPEKQKIILTPDKEIPGGGYTRGIHIYLKFNNKGLSSLDYTNQLVIPESQGCGAKLVDKQLISKDIDITLAKGFCGAGTPGPKAFITIPGFIVNLSSDGIEDETAYKIFSTFKFIDKNSSSTCIPQPSICTNQQVGAYPKECVEPTGGWCPE